MDLEGITSKQKIDIWIPIVVARANGLNYAFTQGDDIISATMAHHYVEWISLGDEREESIQDQTMRNLFPFLPLMKGNVKPKPIKNLKKHPPLVLFG
jgi:light-independent protochlorophyllide reductase subunit N